MSQLPDFLQPLMFRCVMETHEVKAKDCVVFRLPDEMIARIVKHLTDSRVDFGSLALVNQDFRQLARASQFRAVVFDGSPRCYKGILAMLNSEAFERKQNRSYHGQTKRHALGVCIRKVVAYSWGGLAELEHKYNLTRRRGPEDSISTRIKEHHESMIHSVIPSLPNLKILDLSGVTLSQSLFNSLVGCTADTVTLDADVTAVCPDMEAGVSWPITSLTLKLSPAVNHTGNLSIYWESILRLCSPTLERLSMSYYLVYFETRERERIGSLSFDLKFPQLSYLDIKWAVSIDPSALQSLVLTSRKLSYLSIDCTTEPVMELLNRSNGLDALKTLVANFEPASTFLNTATSMNMNFVKNNPVITSFALTRAATPELSEKILSELRHFRRLKRLLVAWGNMWARGSPIKAYWTKLNASLLELYLLIGTDDPLVSYCDHNEIRQILSPRFRGLKRLLVSCRKNYFWRLAGNPRPPVDPDEAEIYDTYLREAVLYGTAFPSLEVVRLEDLTIDIVRHDGGLHAEFSTEQFDFPFLGDFDY